MKRKEMDPKYQWDFTHIYPDKAAWEAAMAEAEQALAGLAALPGTMKVSKEGLKKGLDTVYAAMEKIELPFIYANLHKCADGSEAEHQTMDARAMTLLVKGMSMVAFLNPEVLSIPEEDLAAVQGPDLLEVHKKANMTVSARRKLNEKLKKEKQAIGTPDEAVAAEFRDAALDAPVESRQRIEFAPIDEASARQAEEKDDDYDELL